MYQPIFLENDKKYIFLSLLQSLFAFPYNPHRLWEESRTNGILDVRSWSNMGRSYDAGIEKCKHLQIHCCVKTFDQNKYFTKTWISCLCENFRISSWLVVKVFPQNIKVVNPPMVWEAKNTKPSRSNFYPAPLSFLHSAVLPVSTSSLLGIPSACSYTRLRDYIASAYSTDTWHIISFGQH